jgi:excisionase family DNA binding protein
MPDSEPDRPVDLLTIAEAAALLRAPVATLRYWRHLGTGPRSFRLGRRVLYRRDDLHTWIDAQHDLASRKRP